MSLSLGLYRAQRLELQDRLVCEMTICDAVLLEFTHRHAALERAYQRLDAGADWADLEPDLLAVCPTFLSEARCEQCHEILVVCRC